MRLHSIPASVIAGTLLVLGMGPARGLIFFDTADPAHNREVAPGGAWAGAGWQYQGEFKIFLGTMISPRHFLTARHFGASGGTAFTHRSWFSGEPTDRVYHINPNFNGGLGLQDIPGTDLRIFEVYGDFPGYAELYTKPNEAGQEVVLMGRGRQRGAAVSRSRADPRVGVGRGRPPRPLGDQPNRLGGEFRIRRPPRDRF